MSSIPYNVKTENKIFGFSKIYEKVSDWDATIPEQIIIPLYRTYPLLFEYSFVIICFNNYFFVFGLNNSFPR